MDKKMDYIDVQEVTDETKSLSGTNSPLQNAIQQEKEVQNMLHWSKGQQNQLFSKIIGKAAELNWMWEKILEEFCNQYAKYQHHLELLFEAEKEIDDHNKKLMVNHSRIAKARKQLEAAVKKGDEAHATAHEDELKTLSLQYSSMKLDLQSLKNGLELKKVGYIQGALREQADAFINLAGKCQAIFTAQCGMTVIIPQNSDNTSAANHQTTVFHENVHNLVNCLSEKLGMVAPHEGGVDLEFDAGSLLLSSGDDIVMNGLNLDPAMIDHSDNNELPVPPRNKQPLNYPSSGSVHSKADKENPLMGTTDNQGYVIIMTSSEECNDYEDDTYVLECTTNSTRVYEDIEAPLSIINDSEDYEDITEYQQGIHSSQNQSDNTRMKYATIAGNSDAKDKIQGMSHSYSDSHLAYTSAHEVKSSELPVIKRSGLPVPPTKSRKSLEIPSCGTTDKQNTLRQSGTTSEGYNIMTSANECKDNEDDVYVIANITNNTGDYEDIKTLLSTTDDSEEVYEDMTDYQHNFQNQSDNARPRMKYATIEADKDHATQGMHHSYSDSHLAYSDNNGFTTSPSSNSRKSNSDQMHPQYSHLQDASISPPEHQHPKVLSDEIMKTEKSIASHKVYPTVTNLGLPPMRNRVRCLETTQFMSPVSTLSANDFKHVKSRSTADISRIDDSSSLHQLTLPVNMPKSCSYDQINLLDIDDDYSFIAYSPTSENDGTLLRKNFEKYLQLSQATPGD
ncbi:uncharacterized protein [Dysidea avara]|uniref:uncharacterized protein isoform X2 n=1 Tax=Dysidea avara TaxID=196820 RepID=UPI00331F8118